VSYAGLVLLGGCWLLLSVWTAGLGDRRARAIVWSGWLLLAVGCVAELFLQGPYTAGFGPSSVADLSLLNATLSTGYGRMHLVRLLVLAVYAVLLARMTASRSSAVPRLQISRWAHAAWPAAVALLLTFSLIGHPTTTDPRWLSIGADVLHLAAMSIWVGGLVMLIAALLPGRDPDQLHRALPVISRVSFTAVVVIAASGGYAAWRGIGRLEAILTTEYGLLVLAKVVLFTGLLALGNLSRRVIRRRLGRVPMVATADVPGPAAFVAVGAHRNPGPRPPGVPEPSGSPGPPGRRLDRAELGRMRRSVLLEVALAALVLVATAVLVDQPRGPEALAAAHHQPVSATTALGDGHSATVTIDPGVHGTVGIAVVLSPGTPVQELTATATQPSAQLGPIPLRLHASSSGRYHASDVVLPVAGTWVIGLAVTTSEFNSVTAQVPIVLY
jgi:copper transport protein